VVEGEPSTEREDRDLTFLIHFDHDTELLQDLTPSRDKLERALDQLQLADDARPQMRRGGGGGYPGGGGGGRGMAGTTLYDAILLASDELMAKQTGRKALIVLSDGVGDPSQALAAAQHLATQGAEVDVVGIGTADGAPLKDAKGAFVHDEQGRSVLARLPVDQLQRIASAGRGRYWTLDQLKELIASLGARHANPLGEGEVATERQVSSWRNAGYWLLAPILLLALMLARRGWV
jgi:hypothetical protein